MAWRKATKASFRENKKGVLLMLVSSVCACVGQLLWKLSAVHGTAAAAAGFCFYGLGALIMIAAYRYGKLSVLQPVLSISYVISIVLGAAVLHEPVTFFKCFGVAMIISGVIMIAGDAS